MTRPNRTLEVEVLSEASNGSVLKLPYRRFPGSLMRPVERPPADDDPDGAAS